MIIIITLLNLSIIQQNHLSLIALIASKLFGYKNKLISFIHQEYNKPSYNINNWIFKSHYCRRTFKDQVYK